MDEFPGEVTRVRTGIMIRECSRLACKVCGRTLLNTCCDSRADRGETDGAGRKRVGGFIWDDPCRMAPGCSQGLRHHNVGKSPRGTSRDTEAKTERRARSRETRNESSPRHMRAPAFLRACKLHMSC
jgi:hypothetical protein